MIRHPLISTACALALVVSACGDDDASTATTTSTTAGATSTTVTTTADPTTTAPASSATSSPPTAPPTSEATSEATSEDFITERSCHDGSSEPAFDDAEGLYATFLTSFDVEARSLSFDVVQWLTGDDAVDAWQDEYPDDPDGPPNGYYVVNENPLVRTAPVAPDVTVRLVRLEDDADADLDPGTFEELPGYLARHRVEGDEYLSYNPYWLRFEGGSITEICEQYIP